MQLSSSTALSLRPLTKTLLTIALLLASHAPFSPASGCSPDSLFEPELYTTLDESGRLPAGADLLFLDDIYATETNINITVDGEAVDFTYDFKRFGLSSLHHVSLAEVAPTGAEIIVEMDGVRPDDEVTEYRYEVGDELPTLESDFTEVSFDIVERSSSYLPECSSGSRETYFYINGTELDQSWLYADVIINGERLHKDFLGGNYESETYLHEGLLHVKIDHSESSESPLAEQSAGLIIYDRYGRSAVIRTIGGCKYITEVEQQNTIRYRLLEENVEGCNVEGRRYDLIDEDEEQDNNSGEGQDNTESDGAELNESIEDESGCEQSQPRHLGVFYLLLLPALLRTKRHVA